jgi:hypothetical protein
VLLLLLFFWLSTWAKVMDARGEVHDEAWRLRTGAPAALALLALWGLSATALAARAVRGLCIGAALTDAALALATAGMLLVAHRWIPGGEIREAWVPVFGPLALLGLLDALVRWRVPRGGAEVAFIRAAAAALATVSFAADAAWLPAAVAGWLAVSPAAMAFGRSDRGARAAVEGLALAAAVAAVMAPAAFEGLFRPEAPAEEYPFTRYAWTLCAAVAGALSLAEILRASRSPLDGGGEPAPTA